jgi:hypothetical protein
MCKEKKGNAYSRSDNFQFAGRLIFGEGHDLHSSASSPSVVPFDPPVFKKRPARFTIFVCIHWCDMLRNSRSRS